MQPLINYPIVSFSLTINDDARMLSVKIQKRRNRLFLHTHIHTHRDETMSLFSAHFANKILSR